MKIVGIDPGKHGQMVILDTSTQNAWRYKLKFDAQNQLQNEFFKTTNKILSNNDMVLVEKVSSLGMAGKTQTFNFGFIAGQITFAAKMAGCRFRQVNPQMWQKLIHEGITGKLSAKEKSKIAYDQFYPSDPFRTPKGSN